MAKEKTMAGNPFFRELFQASVYKRSQGRIARQATFAVIALGVAIGAWRLWYLLPKLGESNAARVAIVGAVVAIGVWVTFRLVNMPSFADFLIAVEAEMNKVSWPTRLELVRSSIVVIFTIFVLSGILLAYDLFWMQLLHTLGVV